MKLITRAASGNREATPAEVRKQRLQAYWKLDDVVCRTFLQLGRKPDDFEAVKLFFPLIRELTVCRTPRSWDFLGDTLLLAFIAGNDLGCRHPELQEAILPGQEVEEARHRLRVLLKISKQEQMTRKLFRHGLRVVAEAHREQAGQGDANALAVSLMLRAARAGYAAATFAQLEPALAPIVGVLGEPLKSHLPTPFEQSLVTAPWRMLENGLDRTPQHPLLRLTRELYEVGSLEGATVLQFLDERLKALKIGDEGACPCGELDLLDWVEEGLAFGRRILREEPARVAGILDECAGQRLEISIKNVRQVVGEAGGTEPRQLIRPLLAWYGRVYQEGELSHYGQQLARVGCLADFAVWIPWVVERPVPEAETNEESRN